MELAADHPPHRRTLLHIAWRAPLAIAFLALIVLAPAGTLHFVEGWLYLGVLTLCSMAAVAWLAVHDPELLERRMKIREKEPEQKRLMIIGWLIAVVACGLPGLDHRFGWSDVPMPLVLAGDAAIAAGYLLFMRVIRENRWASRVIEVEPSQRVVDSGPYAVVRHPMYVASIAIYAATPVALGSWWAFLPLPLLLWMLVRRITNEELVLRRDLPGYEEYQTRVKYRLIPGLW